MSYSFPKDAKDGDTVTLENGVEYIFHNDKSRWVVNSVTDSLGAELATQEDIKRLQSEIVELEEEIDAIAPSVERGTWTFNLGGVVGSKGQLTMYDGMNGSGSPIGLFTSVKSVWLNELDNDGTPHGFANVNEGDLIELFVQGEDDYGLFTVVEAHD